MTDIKETSPKELALKNIPTAWREKLIAEAAYVGCKADDDVLWTVISSVINAWASAAAAGRAADAVQSSIDKIPDVIFQGARHAGYDINLDFKSKFDSYGQTLVTAVDESRDKAIELINKEISGSTDEAASQIKIAGNNVKVATETLENMLNGVIQQKTQQGLQEWAEAAKIAGQNAALSASQKIYSKASVVIFGALLGAMLAGATIVYFGASLNNRITPLPIQLVKGHRDCFQGAKGHGYCQLSGTPKQIADL